MPRADSWIWLAKIYDIFREITIRCLRSTASQEIGNGSEILIWEQTSELVSFVLRANAPSISSLFAIVARTEWDVFPMASNSIRSRV